MAPARIKGLVTTSVLLVLFLAGCASHDLQQMNFTEIQLTNGPKGHFINHTQCFSADGRWIVYDTRNHDTLIASTGSIEMVNTLGGEIRELYHTENQSEYGPGVGAATFSPISDSVLFIHGIRNAARGNPYGITRRTGVAIDVEKPFSPIFMDARDVQAPFTAGAMRGGTHAHSWSGDGKWISFTYNDFIIEQLAENNDAVKDLRTVGVSAPLRQVQVPGTDSPENNNGALFSVVIAEVTETPEPGSDQLEKAFDECWIGKNGYLKPDGSRQRRAIAFQGNVRDSLGALKTEVFVADLPEDPESLARAHPGKPLQGSPDSRHGVPEGIVQRRVTYEAEIQGPRHWLRSTSDGSLIGFLAKDKKGFVQVFGISPNGGERRQLTFTPFSVQGPFSFSNNGRYVAYIADNSIFMGNIENGKSERLTPRSEEESKPVGGVVWSYNDNMLAYNRYVQDQTGNFLQIFLLKRK